MKSSTIRQFLRFSIHRVSDVAFPDDVDSVITTTAFQMLAGSDAACLSHLVITVLDATSIGVAGHDECALGVYHENSHHMIVAATYHESCEVPRDEWLRELRLTVAHEILHYLQELDGDIGVVSDDETEEKALAWVQKLECVKS